MESSIVKISGSKPGKTVAVFAGIHGNEKAGVMALRKVISEIKLIAGTAYFVFANPPAIRANVRMIKKNLNRLFLAENKGHAREDKRARELMKLLDGCEALLDLHGYNGPEDTPFIITDTLGLKLASELDFAYVLTGIGDVSDGGTDCYMSSLQKVGLCLECGSNFDPIKYTPLATQSIYTFLAYHGLIKGGVGKRSKRKQVIYKVVRVVKRETDDFAFDKEYVNFDKLRPGKQFARDGSTIFVAEENQYIIFPRPKQKIGEESFVLVSKLP